MIKNHLGYLGNKYAQARFKIINSFSKPGHLLDVGGYVGELRKYLSNGIEYYIVDRDEEAARIKNGFTVDLQSTDISELFGFQFDVIVCSCMLDIVFDPETLLKRVKKILKDDGLLIVSIDNDNTIIHRTRVLFGKGINKTPFNIYYHLRHPTFKQWFKFLDANFERKKIYYTTCFNKEKPGWFDKIALFMANAVPTLFARGAVIQCIKK